jgi:arylsulfatase
LWKRYAWLGGTRTPLVVHWPHGCAARGEVRSQFCHAVDVLPTVLDAAGVDLPEVVGGVSQSALDGASLRATFDDVDATSPRDTQYFEMIGSRAIVRGQWKAVTDHVSQGVLDEERMMSGSRDFASDRWHLFDLANDFSESTDVAAQNPSTVRELQDLWWVEAGRNDVLPLSDGLQNRLASMAPSPLPHRTRLRFVSGAGPIADEVVPILTGGCTIVADLDVPEHGAEGVLCAQGDWTSGWALVVRDAKLIWLVNIVGRLVRVEAAEPLPTGPVLAGVRYVRDPAGGGIAELFAGSRLVGQGAVPIDLPFRWQVTGTGLTIGYDRGFPVSDEYRVPFEWNGTLHAIEFILPSHQVPVDPDDRLRQVLVHE